MSALQALSASVVDFAGLFPPAKLDIATAVQHHGAYLHGPHRALLGRFVVPLARLAEFEAAHVALPSALHSGWQLSVLAGSDADDDAATIVAFHRRQPAVRIVAVETKAAAATEVASAVSHFPADLEVWVELAASAPDLTAQLAAVRAARRGAKLRTGGVMPQAFPSPADVVRFLGACHRAGVVAKATAGLHHPLTGEYRLTYDQASPTSRMFGFINVLLAAQLVRAEAHDADVITLLEDRDPAHFSVSPEAIAWRDHRFTTDQISACRRALLRSFGSCSFTEPLEGLAQLRWL